MIKSVRKNLGLSLLHHRRITFRLIDYRYVRAKDVTASMIKRLAHRNANVQLYTLEVSGNNYLINDDGGLTYCSVSKRPVSELWSEHAQRAGLTKFHRCYVAARK